MFPNEYQLNGDDNFSIIINNTEDDFLNSVRNIESCEDISLLFTVIITLIGLIGHFLTIFVFIQKRFRKNSSHIYMLCLAINNFVYLIIRLSNYNTNNSFSLSDKHNLVCKSFTYLKYVLRFTSAYIIVAFTLQRLLVVWSPFYNGFKSKKSAWLTVCLVFFISCVLNSWSLFLFENNNSCEVKKDYNNEYFLIILVYIVFILIIPIIIITVSNLIIILNIKKSKLKRKELTKMNCKKKKEKRKSKLKRSQLPNRHQLMSYSLNLIEHELSIVKRTYFLNVNQLINNITNQPNNTKNITNLLLVISFSYSLLNLPYLISWCIFYFGELMNRTPLETNQIYSVIKISEIFFLINYSINFYIYCLSGSIFRKQLKYSGKLYLLLTCLDIILI
jgi:hypothetical protein